jgi:hypothetical protein
MLKLQILMNALLVYKIRFAYFYYENYVEAMVGPGSSVSIAAGYGLGSGDSIPGGGRF